jgi:hypothetical protein
MEGGMIEEQADRLLLNLVRHGLQPLSLSRNRLAIAWLIAEGYVTVYENLLLTITDLGLSHAAGLEAELRR